MDKTETLLKDIPAKQNRPTSRKEVPGIGDTCISFDELKGKKIVVTGKLWKDGKR